MISLLSVHSDTENLNENKSSSSEEKKRILFVIFLLLKLSELGNKCLYNAVSNSYKFKGMKRYYHKFLFHEFG